MNLEDSVCFSMLIVATVTHCSPTRVSLGPDKDILVGLWILLDIPIEVSQFNFSFKLLLRY